MDETAVGSSLQYFRSCTSPRVSIARRPSFEDSEHAAGYRQRAFRRAEEARRTVESSDEEGELCADHVLVLPLETYLHITTEEP